MSDIAYGLITAAAAVAVLLAAGLVVVLAWVALWELTPRDDATKPTP